ncbi:APC family permease [Clostridium chromiireducens]|uniref:APC family permease n=1 Tax=Clostridium chromiireducens TaxID=225345 RepID=A0A399ISW4_9CLOT|nr:APC family permease [Clostridium chromiireducens]RII34662.1 APC family permease [Clostridium chromiireducens]
MFKKIQSLLIGRALKTTELAEEKFNVLWGLPILSSDAISSVAYASEEILLVLIPVLGMRAYASMIEIAISITILLGIIVFSYRQIIDSFPHGGGSYIVASQNIGKLPGLVAASSLIIDYLLTVAVSTCAGAAAITSAIPALLPHQALIAIFVIGLIALGNLRGIRDSSKFFGVPTYLFIFSIMIMIITGIFKVLVLKENPVQLYTIPQATGDLTLLLFLKAFSSGCTALTGIEAVSDGIPNFKNPAQRNAKVVLGTLACIVFLIFGGISYLSTMYKASPGEDITVIAQIAIQVFGQNSLMFFVVQATTAVILTLAANTAFSDLPLLLSILAKDGYVPRQLGKRGTRLSFSNGIVLLFLASSVLVYIANGSTHVLLSLYAVGVFISFTLSQFGMFKKWTKSREGNWRHKAFINGLGATVTAVTCIIIGIEKFKHGAWVVLICIPILVVGMLRVRRHYTKVRENLRIETDLESLIVREAITKYVIVPVQTINKSFIKSLNYALTVGENIEVYHVSTDEEITKKLIEKYNRLGIRAPLIIENAPYRNVNEKLLAYVEEKHKQLKTHEVITVVMPQFIIHKWWHQALHNQTSILLRRAILKMRNVVIITVPYIINE